MTQPFPSLSLSLFGTLFTSGRRRGLLFLAAAAVLPFTGCKPESSTNSGAGASTPTAPASGKQLTVGFSQVGAESAWRTAETESVKGEAAKRGVNLKLSDAQGKQDNQIKS